jgi:hypothetical protein
MNDRKQIKNIHEILVPMIFKNIKDFCKQFKKHICSNCNKNCTKEFIQEEAVMVYAGIIDKNYDTDFHRLMANHYYGELSFSVGKSMKPFLNEGDIMMLLPNKFFTPENLKTGDVIGKDYTVYKGNKIFERGIYVHRIIEIEGKEYLIKGDHNKKSDGWCYFSSIKSLLVGYITKKSNYSDSTILRPDLISRWVGMGIKIRRKQEKKRRK